MEKPARNLAVDTYRGFVMLLMMAEVVQLSRVAKALPGNAFWSFLAYHQTHVEWAGCSLHDTIQPGFSFLVGVALPYSIAARIAKSTIRLPLVAGLDFWAVATSDLPLQARLLEVARRADPHPWRDRFRQPDAWADQARLKALAQSAQEP